MGGLLLGSGRLGSPVAFSILQRKAITPGDVTDLDHSPNASSRSRTATTSPPHSRLRYTRNDLNAFLTRLTAA